MNPRQPPAPLTEEDRCCWIWYACQRWPGVHVPYEALWVKSMQSDRRDAFIMLFLESAKANGCHATLTRTGQLHGFIGSFVRMPRIPARDEDYA